MAKIIDGERILRWWVGFYRFLILQDIKKRGNIVDYLKKN
jgi:hypothetical protein